MKKYYVMERGKFYGPVDAEVIRERVEDGRFDPSCKISMDRKAWIPVYEAPEFQTQDPEAQEAEMQTPRAQAQQIPFEYVPESGQAGAGDTCYRQVSPMPPPSGQSPARRILSSPWAMAGLAALCMLVLCIGTFMIWHGPSRDGKSARVEKKGSRKLPRKGSGKKCSSFTEVNEVYGQAVGMVTVTLENSHHQPMHASGFGTAFAVGKNIFVTNCHVANTLLDDSERMPIINSCVEEEVGPMILQLLAAGGYKPVKTWDEYHAFLKTPDGEDFLQKNKQKILDAAEKAYAYFEKEIHVRAFEIRLNNSDGKQLRVKSVRLHPKYGVGKSADDQGGEYDIAILETEEETDVWFPVASKKELCDGLLKVGQEVAYLGFPMEVLGKKINLDNPVANFHDGRISAITTFANRSNAPENLRNITHSIPTTGGASGSPIFLEDGTVVAIVWGMQIGLLDEGRRIGDAIQENCALRIDVLEEVWNARKYPVAGGADK